MDRKHTEVERYIGQLTKEDEAIQAVGQRIVPKLAGNAVRGKAVAQGNILQINHCRTQ